jgi:flavin-dependent dehydrogenase
MSDMQQYDVIVFGAGPSGLAIASELSKDLKVLVFDRKADVSETTKSWLIPDMTLRIGEAEDILPFMKNGVTRFLANTFQGVDVQWQANYKYHFAKEHELLNYWGTKVSDNGSDILLDCWFQDSFITDERVVISTSRGEFCAKLLIDASGGQSPIRGKYALRENWYWWSVCGAIVNFPDGLPKGMQVGDYQLWQTFRDTNADENASLSQGRPVWEYEVLDENSAFVFIFFLGQFRVPFADMETEFLSILREEPSTSDFHNVTITEMKHGWYPSGDEDSQKVTRNRVAFVGSSACWTSPCGWGASFIIANYKKYARQLSVAVKEDNLDKDYLAGLIQLTRRSQYQVLLDQIATHFLSFATASDLNAFIRLFDPKGELGAAGPLMCEKLFTLTITEEEAFLMLKLVAKNIGIKSLIDTIPKEDYLLLVELAVESAEAAVLDVFHKGLELLRVESPNEYEGELALESGFSITE